MLVVCSIASEMSESEAVHKETLISCVNKTPQNSPSANPDLQGDSQEHPIPTQKGNFHKTSIEHNFDIVLLV